VRETHCAEDLAGSITHGCNDIDDLGMELLAVPSIHHHLASQSFRYAAPYKGIADKIRVSLVAASQHQACRVEQHHPSLQLLMYKSDKGLSSGGVTPDLDMGRRQGRGKHGLSAHLLGEIVDEDVRLEQVS